MSLIPDLVHELDAHVPSIDIAFEVEQMHLEKLLAALDGRARDAHPLIVVDSRPTHHRVPIGGDPAS